MGIGSSKFFTNLKDMVQIHKLVFLFLLEPRLLSVKARRILCRLYFTNMVVVEAQGFSGGIWCFWVASRVEISMITANAQSMTIAIMREEVVKWCLTVVYTSHIVIH